MAEAGLFTVAEHVQNTGIRGFADPAVPFSLNENAPQPKPPRNGVRATPQFRSKDLLRCWRTFGILGRMVAAAFGRRSVDVARGNSD